MRCRLEAGCTVEGLRARTRRSRDAERNSKLLRRTVRPVLSSSAATSLLYLEVGHLIADFDVAPFAQTTCLDGDEL